MSANNKPPNAGKGRKKGVPNKLTKTVRESVLAAFDRLGGVRWLVALGKAHPVEFAKLLGKLLPREVTVSSTTNAPPPAALNDPAVLAAALALDEIVDAVSHAPRTGPADAPELPVGAVPPSDPAAPAATSYEATEAFGRPPVPPAPDHDAPATREVPNHE